MDQRGREVKERSGIVQLCPGDNWYTACRFDGWNIHAANIVCRELGYLGYGETSYDVHLLLVNIFIIFYTLTGATAKSYNYNVSDEYLSQNRSVNREITIECQGSESTLAYCSVRPPDGGCSSQSYANITCLQGKETSLLKIVTL